MNNPQPGKPMWEVTNIEDTTEFGGPTGVTPSVKIEFKMHDGTESHVMVPRREFDPDKVGEMIHEHATKLHTLKQFKGPNLQEFSDFQPFGLPDEDLQPG